MLDKLKKIKEGLKSENIVIALFVLIIVIFTAIFMFNSKGNEIIVEKKSDIPIKLSPSPSIVVTPTPSIDEIKVYVVGAVNIPGVVTLKKGQIIDDAIKAAGGLKKEADVDNINLVYKLTENVMLRIKGKNDVEDNKTGNISSDHASNVQVGNSGSNDKNKGFEIVSDSIGAIEDKNGAQSKKGLININTANTEQLMALPGIGQSFAARIIQYRDKNGGFKTKDELKKVTGIGNAKYDAIKDLVGVN